jgi:hypothetical protein
MCLISAKQNVPDISQKNLPDVSQTKLALA